MATASGNHADSASHSRLAASSAKQPGTLYPLVAIVGPTASGKSALALYLAALLNGEVVNYDSVQVYQGFDIASGKVSVAERRGIPHHLLDVLPPDQVMSAGRYRRLALKTLAEIRHRGSVPVLVGGTGLYLRVLLRGLFDGPARSELLRDRLRSVEARRGREFLHRLLKRLDPDAARRIHPRDAQKVIRAVEVCYLAGQPISKLHAQESQALAGFQVFKIGLNPDRGELRHRINQRVESMFISGLLEEVHQMPGSGLKAVSSGPFNALGYRQACTVLGGEINFREAVKDTQAATRRYAKRQLTWFRREPDVIWFDAFGDDPSLQRRVSEWLFEAFAGAELQLSLLTGLTFPSVERTHA
jgi:tRNA dimethylallyltransferase